MSPCYAPGPWLRDADHGGTAVIGGMLTATILAVFYIPMFFVLVRRSVRNGMAKLRARMTKQPAAAA